LRWGKTGNFEDVREFFFIWFWSGAATNIKKKNIFLFTCLKVAWMVFEPI